MIISPAERRKMQAAAQSLVRRGRAGDQNAIGLIVSIRESAKKSKRAALAYNMLMECAKKTKPIIDTDGFEIGVEKPNHIKKLVKYTGKKASDKIYSTCVVTQLPKVGSDVNSSLKAALLIADGREITDDLMGQIAKYCKGDIFFNEKGKAIVGGMNTIKKLGKTPVTEYDVSRDGSQIKINPSGENVYSTGFMVIYNGKPTPIACTYILAAGYNAAVYTDKVLGWAKGMPVAAKRVLQLGYTLGLANKVQGITRHSAKISTLSSMVAWELGE